MIITLRTSLNRIVASKLYSNNYEGDWETDILNKVILYSVEKEKFVYKIPKEKIVRNLILNDYSFDFFESDIKIIFNNRATYNFDLKKLLENVTEKDLQYMLKNKCLLPNLSKTEFTDVQIIFTVEELNTYEIKEEIVEKYFKTFPNIWNYFSNNLHKIFLR
ncbi:MAG: hypothetical protein QXW35_05660 [Candidatus Aenigmatarchaeota archaeon]